MQLSKETLNKLKNYSEINQNILIRNGSVLSTVDSAKSTTFFANTTVSETFVVGEDGFGIYDLSEFLSMMSLFETPNLEFSDKYVTISEGDTSIKYFKANKAILDYSDREVKFPEPDISFNLTAAQLNTLRKVSAILKTNDICVIGDGEEISVEVGDTKNATANRYSAKVGTTDKEFKIILSATKFKFLPGDYTVEVAAKKICRFSNQDVTYCFGIEATSTFSF